MAQSLATFIWLGFLGAMSVSAGWVALLRLAGGDRRLETFRWLRGWTLKGLLVPLALWAVLNLGLSWDFPAFMPQIQQAQNKGAKWLPVYLRYFGAGVFIVTTYWLAITLGWRLAGISRGLAKPVRQGLANLWWICFLALILPALGLLWLGRLPVLGLAAMMVLLPCAVYAPGLIRPPKRSPMYARAVAKTKFGKYAEAELEIIKELEQCEDDFEGWMMMAALYADHFRDLAEAEQTVLDICDQPKVTASQVSVALHRLADWHLKLKSDPDGARRCLEMIIHRFPGSHLARMAQLRINQTPHTASELKDQQVSHAIPMPALGDRLDAAADGPEPEGDRRQAAEKARDCVRALEADPRYVPARERLARLLAEHLGRADDGIAQLRLLLEMEDQPEPQRAEWLSLVAAWHIRYRKDPETGFKVLAQVEREFPSTPQALAARHRLSQRDLEKRAVAQPAPAQPRIRVT